MLEGAKSGRSMARTSHLDRGAKNADITPRNIATDPSVSARPNESRGETAYTSAPHAMNTAPISNPFGFVWFSQLAMMLSTSKIIAPAKAAADAISVPWY
jgi:hypothetical protein